MRLSEHFTLEEFTKSQTALRRGIINKPNQSAIDNMERLAIGILESVREHYGIPFSPSSGYRCPALNSAVGSRPTSQHIWGEAVDFEVPGVSNVVLAHWIAESLIFDQLILECYNPAEGPNSGWVHCSLKADNNRGRILTITKNEISQGLPTID